MNQIELQIKVTDVAQTSSPHVDDIHGHGLDSLWSPIELPVTALGLIKRPPEVMWRLPC